jgi:phosphatidate cytidylyltransferase
VDVTKTIIYIMAFILAVYGVVIVIMSIIFKLQKKDVKSMWVRYLTWFLIIPPLLISLLFSERIFQAIILLLSLLCLREYSRVVGLWKDAYYMVLCYFAILFCFVPVFLNRFGFFQVLPIYLVLIVLLVPVMRGEYEHMIQKSCLAMLGVVYFGWFFAHIAFLRGTQNGIAYVFLLFVLVETNDATSYLTGRLFGRHKLTPRISPNKTNEGFIGGIICVVLLSFLLGFLAPQFSTIHRILFALVISVGGTCGDLVMSFIKRDLQLKDFGKVLPGHGGLLDRLDSLVFVAPLFFHLVNFFYPLV